MALSVDIPKLSGKKLSNRRLVAAMFVFIVPVVLIFIYHQRRLAARTLVYDEWYAGFFAERMCLHTKPTNTACPLEARAEENEFAGRFSAAFAGDSTCSGLRLVIYEDSHAAPKEMMEFFSGDFCGYRSTLTPTKRTRIGCSAEASFPMRCPEKVMRLKLPVRSVQF